MILEPKVLFCSQCNISNGSDAAVLWMTHTPQMCENHAIISQDLPRLKITSFRVTILSVYAYAPILLIYTILICKVAILKHFSP